MWIYLFLIFKVVTKWRVVGNFLCWIDYIGIYLQFFKIAALFYDPHNRTKTDTSSWVEHTKALERTMLKELGKMTL